MPGPEIIEKDKVKREIFSDFLMKHSFITQEAHYGKAIRTFYTQDQASKKPLTALTDRETQPASGGSALHLPGLPPQMERPERDHL